MKSTDKLPKSIVLATAACGVLWVLLLSDWMWWNWLGTALDSKLWQNFLPVLRWVAFTAPLAFGAYWLRWARGRSQFAVAVVCSVVYAPAWQWLVYTSDELGQDLLRTFVAKLGLGGLFFLGLGWVIYWLEWASRHYAALRVRERQAVNIDRSRQDLPASSRRPVLLQQKKARRIWNPADPEAWYYGRESRKLNQSITALTTYAVAFMLAFMLFTQIGGCREIYEMPAGGGVQKTIAQTVKIQKVIKKKFVINPFSSIIFNPPPIDEVKLQLEQATAHLYKVGYGEGDGAGFAGGTRRGKVRFIRLEYSGGDWDQDFGIGADLNMLIQYGVLTGHPVHDQTESRSVAQLRNFPAGKSPPVVYLTGQRNITLSQSEMKILREYLLEKHGMLFGDNGGSYHFHNQFFALMREVLGPSVPPVKVPLDDVIHRIPFQLPFLPYVAPHGGKEAWGWKVDGRWVCYYHPGDIGDAWTDDHSGVPREIWEACYQLGTNVLFYANTEYSKWLEAQKK